MPADQDEKLALIDELAFLIGPLLEPGAAAPPPDDEARQAALGRLAAAPTAPAPARTARRPARALPAARAREAGRAALAAASGASRHRAGARPRSQSSSGGCSARCRICSRGCARRSTPGRSRSPTCRQACARAGSTSRARRAWSRRRPRRSPTTRGSSPSPRRSLAAAPRATGTPIIVTEAGAAVIDAFQQASWLALGLITLLLAVVLRRPARHPAGAGAARACGAVHRGGRGAARPRASTSPTSSCCRCCSASASAARSTW